MINRQKIPWFQTTKRWKIREKIYSVVIPCPFFPGSERGRNDRRQARKHLELPPIWIEEQQNQIRSLEMKDFTAPWGENWHVAVPFHRRNGFGTMDFHDP